MKGSKPVFFASQLEFRKWLEQNHDKEDELLVGFYKVGSGRLNMTWSQSVDEALCFGWIDGIRRSIDDESYCIRFTPRRPGSSWSKVNLAKVEELTAKGLMQPAGIESFNNRKIRKSGAYSYENPPEKLPADLELRFKENAKAWDFFINQAPSYQKTVYRWIMDARQDATRHRRLDKIIKVSESMEKMF